MARKLATVDSLTKLLDESSRPIYVVDAERRIVYCNPALGGLDRFGAEANRRAARRIPFGGAEADDDEPAMIRRRSPICARRRRRWRAKRAPGTISLPWPAAVDWCIAQAEFVPLGVPSSETPRSNATTDRASSLRVLVLLAGEDMSPQEVAAELSGEPTADELHRTIRRFRRGQASRYSIESLLGASSAMQKVRAQVEARPRAVPTR